jgi:hypothetical protein
MKKWFQNITIYIRGYQAGRILKTDERKKRDPLVADRLPQIKAQHEMLQLMLKNPKMRERLGPDVEQNAKYLSQSLPRLEQIVKKNPNVTMKQLVEMAQNPQLQQPQIRTRPGPPQRGRRHY